MNTPSWNFYRNVTIQKRKQKEEEEVSSVDVVNFVMFVN